MTRTCLGRWVGTSFVVLGALACDQQRQPAWQPPAPPPNAADSERYRRDSAQYAVDSAKWAHDVFVLDSISRSINTDSLYRLYHLELAARDPAAIEHAILCETDHLFTVYGDEPAGRAETRMEDTVYTSAERASSNAIFARLREKDPAIGLSYQKGNYNCGQEHWPPRMPQFYHGTRTDVLPASPRRPQRP